ncbi:hypothetical protein [Paenibacillus tyrfis]|uniref:hypothetical protein n=1 Tax=Paenibacillus tyrfis TaxID=1501230 RepID=UPI00209FE91C|nr:hypothetical protein [Paenibacillus tyrfis]MCP1312108.1 hypothetical protein [Paenibacillus tyrfis]
MTAPLLSINPPTSGNYVTPMLKKKEAIQIIDDYSQMYRRDPEVLHILMDSNEKLMVFKKEAARLNVIFYSIDNVGTFLRSKRYRVLESRFEL